MMNASILLFQYYLKAVLYHSGHISHCEIDFVKIQLKESWSGAEVKTILEESWSGAEVKTILEEEMVKLVRVRSIVMPLENFLRKCNMGYTLYPWISLLESTLETSYKPQT